MKKNQRTLSLILVMAIMMIMCSFPASADNAAVPMTVTDSYYKAEYKLYTLYGDYTITGGSLVGYGCTNRTDDVKGVQAALKTINHFAITSCDPGSIDGLFGSATYQAIYNFQNFVKTNIDSGISVDGCAGNQTWYYLERVINNYPGSVCNITDGE